MDSQIRQAMEQFEAVFQRGAAAARETLALMMNRELSMKVLGVREMAFEDVSRFRFPEDVPVAMIILRLSGEANGFLAFLMFEESAKKLNQILWEETPESSEVLNLSNVSAIKEMGNIVGSCFLNKLADASGVELRPSEPIFIYDLMAAIMEVLMLEQSLTSDRAIIVDTEIRSQEEGISFDVLFLPSNTLFSRLCAGLLARETHD